MQTNARASIREHLHNLLDALIELDPSQAEGIVEEFIDTLAIARAVGPDEAMN